jgi:hypothetical protein
MKVKHWQNRKNKNFGKLQMCDILMSKEQVDK